MTLFKCLNCGHEWESRAKRPQCPQCKRYRVETVGNSSKLNDVNDEPEEVGSSEDEPVEETKTEKDLYTDVTGETIIEKKPKKKAQKKKGINWKLTNVALVIGAIAAGCFALWFWLFTRDVQDREDKKVQEGPAISDAWAGTLGLR